MKNLRYLFLGLASVLVCTASAQQQHTNPAYTTVSPSTTVQALRIGVVDTKRCLEESKLGKQEQANFEKMKNQMESVLQEKEKALKEIDTKLMDEDYMDSVSSDVEGELKRKKRTLRQEGMQLQEQYMQTLQQTNLKIVKKIKDSIEKASAQVAQDSTTNDLTLDAIATEEAFTFFKKSLDVTDRIVVKMDQLYDLEQKTNLTPSK